MPDGGTRSPISVIATLNRWRSSAVRIASTFAPIISTSYVVEHARLVQRDREVEAGLAAERRQQRVGAFLGR